MSQADNEQRTCRHPIIVNKQRSKSCSTRESAEVSISATGLSSAHASSRTSGLSSASSFPSPSLSFPGLSPSAHVSPPMTSSGVGRRASGHRNGSMTPSTSYRQNRNDRLPLDHQHGGFQSGEVNHMQRHDSYRHASHYNYLQALQQSSQSGPTSSRLGK